MDLFLFEKLAVARLRQRCTIDPAGTAYFRIDGESAVALPAAEWEALGRRFRTAIAPSARRLRWSIWLAIPVAIATLIALHAVPPLEALFFRLDSLLPGLVPVALGSGLPLAAMIAHMLAVQREIDRTRTLLAGRSRLSPPMAPRSRALNAVELVAIVLLGPHLLFQIYGSLVPDAFRNTPWTGTHLDASGWAGLAVLIALIVLRLRARRDRPLSGEEMPTPSAEVAPGTPANRFRTQTFGRKQA